MKVETLAFIIRKNGEYLVAVPYTDTVTVRWSNSPYDGFRTQVRHIAESIADRVGGVVVEFDPITGGVN